MFVLLVKWFYLFFTEDNSTLASQEIQGGLVEHFSRKSNILQSFRGSLPAGGTRCKSSLTHHRTSLVTCVPCAALVNHSVSLATCVLCAAEVNHRISLLTFVLFASCSAGKSRAPFWHLRGCPLQTLLVWLRGSGHSTPTTCGHSSVLCTGQEYWSGVPLPSPMRI